LRRRGFFDFFRRKDDEDDKEEKSEEKESGIGTRRFGSNDKRLRSNNLLRMEQDEPMDERNALIFKQITKREYELSKNGVKFTWAPTRRFWTTVTLKDAKGNRMASFITRGLRMRKIDVTIFTENKEIVPEIVLTAYLTLRGSRSSKMAKFKSFFFK
jgi:hypothetical protein